MRVFNQTRTKVEVETKSQGGKRSREVIQPFETKNVDVDPESVEFKGLLASGALVPAADLKAGEKAPAKPREQS